MTMLGVAVIDWFTLHLPTLLAVVGYLLTLAFVPVVLIRKRQPAAAIAWSMSIILLPYLGTLLFLLIGVPQVSRRLRRKQFHRSRFIRQWIASTADQPHHPHPPINLTDGSEWQQMDRFAGVVGAVKLSSNNQTLMYHEGTKAFHDKLQAIRDAEHHVHAEYYILRADHTGKALVDLLCERAQAGLEVRLVVDAVGSRLAKRMLQQLREAGGHAALFLPIMAWQRRFLINLRNHRKILVCDGRVAFTGGLNIGDEYLGKTKRYGYWRDTQLQVTGPAVLALQRVFVEDWDFASGEFLSGKRYFPAPVSDGDTKVQVIWSGPDAERNAIQQVYHRAICVARKRLWIATPYLVPDQAIMAALKAAALHGVDVRIITQSSPPDHWIAYFAARYSWRELLESGVRLYQYTRGMMHAKVLTADGEWASVGSANLDNRSLRLNFEVNCLLYSKPLVVKLEQRFRKDMSDSVEVQLADLEHSPLHWQLAENVCRLVSPIL